MTPPLTRPPIVNFIAAGIVGVLLVIPLARRDDWLGWFAFLYTLAIAILLWGILMRAFLRGVARWWSGDSDA